MVSVLSLQCPVCGAPFTPGAERCGYCGSILVLQTDHPRIDPRTLNRAVVDKHIAEYRELLQSDPNAVQAHYGLGVAYFNLGLTEAAISSLEKASSLTPENPHIHTQLAVAWREEAKTGNEAAIGEMRDHIRYALRLDPNNVEALILASEDARRDNDIERAMSFAERAMAVEPERAGELFDRTRREWIAWKHQRGEPVPADALPIAARPVPAASSVERSAVPLQMPGDLDPSPLRAAMKGLLRAMVITVGLFFAGVFATAISSSLATVFAYIVLFSLLLWLVLPIVAARRSIHSSRERDQRS